MASEKELATQLIRPAAVADADRISQVLQRCIREVCAPHGYTAAVIEEWCANKTPSTMAEWIACTRNYFIVIELAPHGIVGAALYRRPDATINLCHLAPEGLHRGFGGLMLAELEAEAQRLGHAAITVQSSLNAVEFYRRHGYTTYGELTSWGDVPGIPMRKVLSAAIRSTCQNGCQF